MQQCADLQIAGSSPAEFTAHFRREIDRYAKIIKLAAINPED
jgi:tripartite-type tricarboxylate transporter receptor subunit TctC